MPADWKAGRRGVAWQPLAECATSTTITSDRCCTPESGGELRQLLESGAPPTPRPVEPLWSLSRHRSSRRYGEELTRGRSPSGLRRNGMWRIGASSSASGAVNRPGVPKTSWSTRSWDGLTFGDDRLATARASALRPEARPPPSTRSRTPSSPGACCRTPASRGRRSGRI